MQVENLPPWKPIVATANMATLAMALRQASPPNFLTHYDIVRGAPCSGRIFFASRIGEAIALDLGVETPEDLASDLLRKLRAEARYDPPNDPSREKGWEVSVTEIERHTAVLVWAAWVPKGK